VVRQTPAPSEFPIQAPVRSGSAQPTSALRAGPGTPGYTPTPAPHIPTPPPIAGAVPAPPPRIPTAGDGLDPDAPLEAILSEGNTVAQRYRLEKKIGQGGMAAVFKAYDLELAEVIAIKFFTQIITDEQMLLRFKQELTLSRQLSHPNIVRLYDIGSHRGMRFITMELLQGSDLRGRLARPFNMVEAIDWLLQACAGLQAAHDRGVVHRDIKPENFFVTHENILKVMDFGIAKRTTAAALTQAGMMAGTPEYMSPEQVTNFANVTHSTDLYALGVVAYEMFAGSVPFTHQELLPLLMKHVNEAPEPPRRRNPRCPPDVEAIILKLLAKAPGDRFKTCNELAQALSTVRARPAREGL
jgi:serine/threonine-protein kinase